MARSASTGAGFASSTRELAQADRPRQGRSGGGRRIMACSSVPDRMTVQRLHRGDIDRSDPFDWLAEARARGIERAQAEALLHEARARAARQGYADPKLLERGIYLDLL